MRYRDGARSVDWIASDADLRSACENLGSLIALDTEFIRTDTYYPVPGLYQIGTTDRVLLIDPQAVTQWDPLKVVLQDPGCTKIMHACLEDLELLYHHLGITLEKVFDTQYANAFVSGDFSLSYAALVDQILQVNLPKHETRSNWLKRPLSDDQVNYAIEDVVYLHALYDSLTEDLVRSSRLEWFHADMAARQVFKPVDPATYYRGLKKAWRLSPLELSYFQALCQWREETAQTENVPRNRVVWDEHLFTFATCDNLSQADLRASLPGSVARRYSQDILGTVAAAGAQAPDPLPPPLTSAQGSLVKVMRRAGLEQSDRLGIAPELLCRKRDLEECVRHHARHGALSETFSTWREPLVGNIYLQILEAVER